MLEFSIWRLEFDQSALKVSHLRRLLAGCSKYFVSFSGQHASLLNDAAGKFRIQPAAFAEVSPQFLLLVAA
jgi:hypothetical protein